MSGSSPLRICERCFAAIDHDEEYVRLAHLGWARPDGTVHWLDSFVHTTACATTAPPAPARAARSTPVRDHSA